MGRNTADMSCSPPRCPRGHPMRVQSRFKLDDEPGDDARTTAMLARWRAEGLELGADVTLYYCAACDYAEARFDYGEKDAS
jgi:hypothetical protein